MCAQHMAKFRGEGGRKFLQKLRGKLAVRCGGITTAFFETNRRIKKGGTHFLGGICQFEHPTGRIRVGIIFHQSVPHKDDGHPSSLAPFFLIVSVQ